MKKQGSDYQIIEQLAHIYKHCEFKSDVFQFFKFIYHSTRKWKFTVSEQSKEKLTPKRNIQYNETAALNYLLIITRTSIIAQDTKHKCYPPCEIGWKKHKRKDKNKGKF